MDLRHVSYFAAAAELGSISRAATMFGTSQPSVTRQIRALEKELGVSLLRRSSRGVEATAAGEALLRQHRWISDELARVPEIVAAAGSGTELVRVGLPPGLPSAWFLAIVQVLRGTNPTIEMDLVDLGSSDQEQALRRSTLDLAFMHHAPREFQTRQVLTQALGIALHPDRDPRFAAAAGIGDLGGASIIAPSTWASTGRAGELEEAPGVTDDPIRWRFKRFTEHVGLMASAAQADGILLTAASASQFVPQWPWMALESHGRPLLRLNTYAVYHKPPMMAVQTIVDAASAVSSTRM